MRKASFFRMALLFVIAVAGPFIRFERAFAVEYDAENSGYLISVKDERYELSKEFVIIAPEESTTPPLRERIFTDKLSADFQERYEKDFGRTEAQQIQNTPSRFFEKELKPGEYVSEEEYLSKQHKFGTYMSKRLVEFHVDNYLRNTPSMHGVYEVKEALGNMSIEGKKGFKLKYRYSISGNQLEMNVVNPYDVEAKVTFYKIQKMGASDQETKSSLGYNFTKTIKLVTDYSTNDSQWSTSVTKKLRAGWSTSLTGTKSSVEDKVLVGLAWRD